MEGVHEYMYQDAKMDLVQLAYVSPVEGIKICVDYPAAGCQGMRKSNGIQTLLNYPKDFKFDLVLYDYSCGPCILGFLHRFNYPPLVGWTAFNNPPYTINVAGGHNFYSYKPYFTSKYTSDMSFWERVYNLYLYAVGY